jgi:hypothetical protein
LNRRAWPALIAATVLCVASSGALAQAAVSAPAPHHLWVSHLLVGSIVGGIAFAAARWWALALIVLFGALGYALTQIVGHGIPPEAIEAYGSRYPIHVQASALFVPLMVLFGFAARATANGLSRTSPA